MYFATINELLTMNGHGIYVWSAYGICFAVLLMLVGRALHRHTQLRREIDR
ncbi:MAG: heme exporter protein CcmD [Pseudomonadales bacterium]|nr:heme exporter protein CcmD [Pseudomonadales bacterium]